MTPTAIKFTTNCLHCTAQFQNTPLHAPLVGQKLDERLIKLVEGLVKHMAVKHLGKVQMFQAIVQEFSGYCAVTQFEMQDPTLQEMREAVRASLHKATRKTFITDEEIEARVSRLNLLPELAEGIATLVKDMRDVLTEEGEHAPAKRNQHMIDFLNPPVTLVRS